MADAVALVDDLFFQAKMTETARHTGVDLKTVTDCDALLREAAAMTTQTIVPTTRSQSVRLGWAAR